MRFRLYTDRVDGQVRWKLVEGFSHVPAVQFWATELMAQIANQIDPGFCSGKQQ